ncbi:MAG: hypothetical protein Q8R81_04965 [Novosphingobium sp.]|uniref:hypothetical protein n=1 Tax=Novosphingobium sp. TaxID=1874826 RepID=UPI002735CE24|nr:hypothetical protein [Novosphingobium sp.]MDP3549727.1 hypothetical protein [Novosphingobium sp.]
MFSASVGFGVVAVVAEARGFGVREVTAAHCGRRYYWHYSLRLSGDSSVQEGEWEGMLEISSATFERIGKAHGDAFAYHVAKTLWEEMPQDAQALGWEGLCGLVRQTMALAQSWDVDDEEALGLLCAMALCFGPDTLTYPSVRDYVQGGDDTVQRIHDLLDASVDAA